MLKEPFHSYPVVNSIVRPDYEAPNRVSLLLLVDGRYYLVLLRLDLPNTYFPKKPVGVSVKSVREVVHLDPQRFSNQTPDTGPPPSTPQAQTDSTCSTDPSSSSTHPLPQSQQNVPCPRPAQLDEFYRSTISLIQRTLHAYADVVLCSGTPAPQAPAFAQLSEFQRLLQELTEHL